MLNDYRFIWYVSHSLELDRLRHDFSLQALCSIGLPHILWYLPVALSDGDISYGLTLLLTSSLAVYSFRISTLSHD